MSDNFIVLIPSSPSYLPSREAQQQALELFREFTGNADEVTTEALDSVQFFDCGENFERALCPACKHEIDTGWFGDRMSESYSDGFRLAPINMPCCGAQRRLDELKFEWPQGFARFSLEAKNASVGELPQHAIARLERILGCNLITILRRL